MIDEQAGQSTPAPRQWREGEPKPGEVVRAFWYDEPFIGKVRNASVELTQGGTKIAVRDVANDLLHIVDRSTATPAERCYFEGCDSWILGESDFCPEHEAAYGPVPPSSVSPSGENTTPVGEDTGGDSSDAQRLAELIAATDRRMSPEDFAEPRRAARVLAEAVLAEGWRPPLPDSETEWGWRRTYDKPDDVVVAFSEDDARSRIAFLHNAVVVSRPVGPWTIANGEVTS